MSSAEELLKAAAEKEEAERREQERLEAEERLQEEKARQMEEAAKREREIEACRHKRTHEHTHAYTHITHHCWQPLSDACATSHDKEGLLSCTVLTPVDTASGERPSHLDFKGMLLQAESSECL